MVPPTRQSWESRDNKEEGSVFGIDVSRRLTLGKNSSFSPVLGHKSHSSPVATPARFQSVSFSSLCEINKFSSLEARESGLQRQAEKLAQPRQLGTELNYLSP